ncbi:MAG TPA: bifunctional methylenetetrahydrofolate dehydrogenase/methenyltetrahydrofolate cyclohydrolase FolD [Candidatus Polarisedimenticolia bacterium]|nr:bifunctional methylenetetrahydrofolate dehydrogenase/methenyltetrahydrofolate cyclohydrolase FolD [Candidatus Polarisedimenticolia bacterium]
MTRLLDGRKIAAAIRAEAAAAVTQIVSRGGAPPGLATVLVGENPASSIYVRNKVRACKEVGIVPHEHRLPASTTQADLLALVASLGREAAVDGILVQMPLPSGIQTRAVIEAIDPGKDVDGFHPINVGRLWSLGTGLAPCTPAGIIEMLEREGIAIEGAEAVVLGRSEIVGKPMAALLLARHATVTICHSRTRRLQEVTARAEILVVAAGRAALVTKEFIKPGATVIDVGINRVTSEDQARALFGEDEKRLDEVRRQGYTLVGDVHPTQVRERAGAYTPVPGGVGPLTVAMLLKNTVTLAAARRA